MQNNWAKAKENLDRAIKINPKNDDAYRNRGYTYGGLREYELAEIDFDKALEINPHKLENKVRKAMWLTRFCRFGEAYKMLMNLTDIERKSHRGYMATTYYNKKVEDENYINKALRGL